MNFSQMNYFRAVAEEEHISRAAEKLHISQPSLSATIHRMELELNTPLFDRKGRNIYLNDAGRNLLDHVNYIFSKMNYLEKELRNKEFELSNTVSLAVNNSMFLDNWFSDILISNKIVRISQRVMSEVQMLEALETESVDIALGDFSNVPSGIVSYMLVPDEYIIVVPTSHPLASHEVLYFEDIRNEPFVALSSSTSARIMDRLFAQKNVTPNLIFEGQQNMMFQILRKGKGVLFASKQMIYMKIRNCDYGIRRQDVNDLCMLPIVDLNTKYNLSVCWKEERELPVLAMEFIRSFIEDYPRFNKDISYCENNMVQFIL